MQATNTSPFTKQTFENRYTVYQSIDVEVLGYGGPNSSLVDIRHPVQLNGFLAVLMSEQAITVSCMSHASVSKWPAPCASSAGSSACATLLEDLRASVACRDFILSRSRLLKHPSATQQTASESSILVLQVQALPINISDSSVLQPVLQQMNLGIPTTYVLGTVLQVQLPSASNHRICIPSRKPQAALQHCQIPRVQF